MSRPWAPGEAPVKVWAPDREEEPPGDLVANFTPIRVSGTWFTAHASPEDAARLYVLELNGLQFMEGVLTPGGEYTVRVRTDAGRLYDFDLRVSWAPYETLKGTREVSEVASGAA